jgi:nucleoside-diphosphate kinase
MQGFKIVSLKSTQLTIALMLKRFTRYILLDLFYGELVEFMSRGPIIAAILEKKECS